MNQKLQNNIYLVLSIIVVVFNNGCRTFEVSDSNETKSEEYGFNEVHNLSYPDKKSPKSFGGITAEDLADSENLNMQEKVRIQALSQEVNSLFGKAFSAMDQGQWALAVNILSQVELKLYDKEIFKDELQIAHYVKSDAYYQMAKDIYDRRREGGDMEQAEKFIKQALEIDPANEKAENLKYDISVFRKRVLMSD
ncbi:hypothetical protein P3T73_13055 [Kiritimatiellota bacterium B12222]|nr:hypothetical protein P3T73_13055 [Kiritimatiellota bacterium B12222]